MFVNFQNLMYSIKNSYKWSFTKKSNFSHRYLGKLYPTITTTCLASYQLNQELIGIKDTQLKNSRARVTQA